jgi:hypothetical protein
LLAQQPLNFTSLHARGLPEVNTSSQGLRKVTDEVFFILCATSFCTAGAALAQALDMSIEAFRRVAVTVILVDDAFERCEKQKRYSPQDKALHTAWPEANAVHEIRRRIHAVMADSDTKQSTEQIKAIAIAIAIAIAKFRGGPDSCVFFRAAVKSPDAQLASAAPEVLARLKQTNAAANEALVGKPKVVV